MDVVLGEPPAWLHPVVWMGRMQAALRRRAPRSPPLAFMLGRVHGGDRPVRLRRGSVARPGAHARFRALDPRGVPAQERVRGPRARDGGLERVAPARRQETSTLRAPRFAAWSRGTRSRSPRRSSPPRPSSRSPRTHPTRSSRRSCSTRSAACPARSPTARSTPSTPMIGYRGELEWLGKAAARLDDVANLLPARVTALLLALAAPLGRGSVARAIAVWARDRRLTESPNAGHPMAAMAGVLGVELEKTGHYRLGAGLRAPAARGRRPRRPRHAGRRRARGSDRRLRSRAMRPEPRPELVALPAAIHGGSHDARLLDFSTGVSPLPPPEEIVAAVRNADLSRYPHPTALPVREAIGALARPPREPGRRRRRLGRAHLGAGPRVRRSGAPRPGRAARLQRVRAGAESQRRRRSYRSTWPRRGSVFRWSRSRPRSQPAPSRRRSFAALRTLASPPRPPASSRQSRAAGPRRCS